MDAHGEEIKFDEFDDLHYANLIKFVNGKFGSTATFFFEALNKLSTESVKRIGDISITVHIDRVLGDDDWVKPDEVVTKLQFSPDTPKDPYCWSLPTGERFIWKTLPEGGVQILAGKRFMKIDWITQPKMKESCPVEGCKDCVLAARREDEELNYAAAMKIAEDQREVQRRREQDRIREEEEHKEREEQERLREEEARARRRRMRREEDERIYRAAQREDMHRAQALSRRRRAEAVRARREEEQMRYEEEERRRYEEENAEPSDEEQSRYLQEQIDRTILEDVQIRDAREEQSREKGRVEEEHRLAAEKLAQDKGWL